MNKTELEMYYKEYKANNHKYSEEQLCGLIERYLYEVE
jgi:hypothetical protein